MAMKIRTAECIGCGDCKPICPTKSITEKDGIFKITTATCTECAGDFDDPQCVDVCPVDGCIIQI